MDQVTNLQRIPGEVYKKIANIHGYGEEKIAYVPRAGMPHAMKLRTVKIMGEEYCIGYHKSQFVNSILVFSVGDPIKAGHDSVFLRFDAGRITKDNAFDVETFIHGPSHPVPTSTKLGLVRLISMVMGEKVNVMAHFGFCTLKPRTVSTTYCEIYKPFKAPNQPSEPIQVEFPVSEKKALSTLTCY